MAGCSLTHRLLSQLSCSQSDISRGNEGGLHWASCAQQTETISLIKTFNKQELEETLPSCSFESGNCCLLKLNYRKLDKER